MNSFITFKTLAFVLLLFASLPAFSQTYLKVDGKKIVNEKGEEIILRGMGLGGWMLQEGYMLQMSGFANSQRQIKAKITEVIGPVKTEEFYKKWRENHFRKIDADSMASWGFNSVRLAMHYNLYTLPIEEEPVPGQQTWLEEGFAMTDSLLKWCQANKMYLIFDLHAAPGGQGKDEAISDYNPAKPSLWESPANQAKTVALWRKLTERYMNEPYIGGYDLLNEPNWGFVTSNANGCNEVLNKPLNDLSIRIKDTIRAIDKKHIIYIEGNCWGNNHNGLWPFPDDNVVLSFHKYWNYTDKGSIQGLIDLGDKYNVPIWLGETGENSNTWFRNTIKLAEENKIGWAWWPLKKLGLSAPMEVQPNAGYQKLLNYWNNPSKVAKPSESEAYAALMQLTEDIKLENTFYHKDVVDAMFRQVYSDETIPFRPVTLTTPSTVIYAADYDLGRYGKAYSDKDTANYHVSAPPFQAWNKGWAYRNDGVDIQRCNDSTTNGYCVGWTENGEWLKYTITVAEKGNYNLKVRSASLSDKGKITISSNGIPLTQTIALPNTGGANTYKTTLVKDVYLNAGKNVLVVNIETGGFNFNYMEFTGPHAVNSDAQPVLLSAISKDNANTIAMVFNHPFSPISLSRGFKVKVNGAEVSVDNVSLKTDYSQVLLVKLAQPLTFGDFVYVSYNDNHVTTTGGVVLAPVSDYQVKVVLPDPRTEKVIPGKIEAEDMDINEGLGMENTTDQGGGLNIGYTDAGDVFAYNVKVKESGKYQIQYRTAGQSTGKIKLFVVENNIETLIDTKEFASTGGWQKWVTVSSDNVSLTEGDKQIKVEIVQGGFNMNWINFVLTSADQASPLRFIKAETDTEGSKLFVILNKPVAPTSLSKTGLKLILDGVPTDISAVTLKGNDTLSLSFNAQINANTIIKVAYDGTGSIKSVSGSPLTSFNYQLAFNNTPVIVVLPKIPGKIEAEDYTVNKGFETEPTTDEGGGLNIGFTEKDDHLEYEVMVEKAGNYRVDFRVAAMTDTGSIKLFLANGALKELTTVTFAPTAGWQTWTTVSSELTLEAGKQTLRVVAGSNGFNLNWMNFEYVETTTSDDNVVKANSIKIYPNPTSGSLKIVFKDANQLPNKFFIRDLSGKTRLIEKPLETITEIDLSKTLSKGLYFMIFEFKNHRVVKKLVFE